MRATRWDLDNARERIKYAQSDLRLAQRNLAAAKVAMKKLMKKLKAQANGISSKALIERVAKTVAKPAATRYALFNQIVKHYSPFKVFRDRLPDGRLSVKVGFGNNLPTQADRACRRLADSFKEYKGGRHFRTKLTRFYFNVPRRK
jgi:hypothetical protein